ncbi:unnamed protein product, partial [Effrenium voratum]
MPHPCDGRPGANKGSGVWCQCNARQEVITSAAVCEAFGGGRSEMCRWSSEQRSCLPRRRVPSPSFGLQVECPDVQTSPSPSPIEGRLTLATWNVQWLFDGIDDPPPAPLMDPAKGQAQVAQEIVRRALQRGSHVIVLGDLNDFDAAGVAADRHLAALLSKTPGNFCAGLAVMVLFVVLVGLLIREVSRFLQQRPVASGRFRWWHCDLPGKLAGARPKLRQMKHGMGKEDKREFVMFEGQQEYDWERSIKLKMQAQMRRRDVHTKECLERVTRALHRRWRRQRDRDKARNMQQLAALVTAIDETQVALDKIRKEHLDAVEKEVEDLERERRRLQEQTRVLMGAALVVRQEKARINKAWYAEPREKRALTFQSLKTVRRLHSDMISFPVTAEFKQKHSVLLYSLRMLEGRLRKDCPYAKDSDIQEGPLEETPEHKKQMEEIDADFEEQLAADSDELRAISRSKAQRAMAREAAQRRQAAEDMLAPALKEASEALRRCERAARRTEIAEDLLRPLAALSAQLGAE